MRISDYLKYFLIMLDKSIQHGKEKRKQYRKPKAVDKTCRNHGSCPYCKANRTAKEKEKEKVAKEQIKLDVAQLEER